VQRIVAPHQLLFDHPALQALGTAAFAAPLRPILAAQLQTHQRVNAPRLTAFQTERALAWII